MFLSNINRLFVFVLILSLFVSHVRPQEDSDEDVDEGADDEDSSDGDSDDSSGGSDGAADGPQEGSDPPESTTTPLTTSSTATTTTTTTTTAKPVIKTTESVSSKSSSLPTTTTVKPVTTGTPQVMSSSTTSQTLTSNTTNLKPKSDNKKTSKNAKQMSEDEDEEEDDNKDDDENEDKKAAEEVVKEVKTKPNSEIEREDNDLEEDYEEEEGNGGSNGDYFDEPTREDLLKALIQRTMGSPELNLTANYGNKSVEQRWIEFIGQVDNGLQSLVRAITPTALDAFYEMTDLSPSCSNSLLRIATGLQQTQEWAFKMIDANGKFPTGLMSGTLSSLGAYDQCMETVATDEGQELFRGQYCLLKLRPPLPPLKGRISYHRPVISLNGSKYANTWLDSRIAGRYATGFYSTHVYNGLCLPSSCTEKELNAITTKYIGNYFDVSIDYCDHRSSSDSNQLTIISAITRLNVMQRIALSIIMVSIVMVLFASLVEMYAPDYVKYQPFGRFIVCFSLISNTKKLFHINREKMDEKLAFVHGIRVLTMIWIIAIHTFTVGTLFVPMLVYRFEDEARKFGKQLSTQFIFNGFISVGNFFFLSGLVVTYISVPMFKRTGAPTLFSYISMRWFRFMPSMIGIICFHILWPLMGSGPVFKKYANELTEPCSRNWWTNILFINNWLLLPDMCLVHTWFMSADFQLHILSFFAILALSKTWSRGFGVVLCTSLILCGIAIPSLVNYKTNGPPMPMPFEEPDLDQFYRDLNTQYHPTYNHLSTYFVGVLVGFILTRSKDLRLSWPSNTILWTILPVFTLSATFATYLWTGLEWEYSKATAAAYSGLHRFVYILMYAWIAIYCSANSKSLLTRFLGSKFFIPLSRLSFSVYLTHILVVWYFVLETRELIRFTYRDFVYATGGVILYSMFLSLLLYLLFESVWSNVLSLMFKKHPKSTAEEVKDQMQRNIDENPSQIFIHTVNGKPIESDYNHKRHMETNNHKNSNNNNSDGYKWRENSVNGNSTPEYRMRSMGTGSVFVDVGHVGPDVHHMKAHINQSFNGYHSDARNTKL